MNKKTENENKTKENIKESKDANINKSNTIENSQNNEKQKLLDIKNDYVFKRTFGYKGDEEVTKVLLRDILGMKVNEIDLDVNPITEKELMDDKLGIMDIASVVNDNVQVDIEMQVVNKNNIDILITVGKEAKNISKIAKRTVKEVYTFENNEQVKELLWSLLKKGDAVLVKASNGMKFSEICGTIGDSP